MCLATIYSCIIGYLFVLLYPFGVNEIMMGKKEKLISRFKSKPKDFTWSELRTLLLSLGYSEFNAGSTSGSRVKFIRENADSIMLHKPQLAGPIPSNLGVQQVPLLRRRGRMATSVPQPENRKYGQKSLLV
jgi:hypothetical protein